MPTRRRFIGTVGVLTGLAGCASIGGSEGGIQPQPRDVVYDTDTVSAESYGSWAFSTERSGFLTVTFAVQRGPDVDVFVMGADAFERYEAGERFEAYAAAASAGGEFSVNLPTGDHVAVVDNTSEGAVAPSGDGAARVELSVTLQ